MRLWNKKAIMRIFYIASLNNDHWFVHFTSPFFPLIPHRIVRPVDRVSLIKCDAPARTTRLTAVREDQRLCAETCRYYRYGLPSCSVSTHTASDLTAHTVSEDAFLFLEWFSCLVAHTIKLIPSHFISLTS